MRVHCGRWAGPQQSYLQELVRSCPHRMRAPFPHPSICCGLWADLQTAYEINTMRVHCGRWAGPQIFGLQESVGAVRIEFGLHSPSSSIGCGLWADSQKVYEIRTMRVHCGLCAGPQTSYLRESVRSCPRRTRA